MRCEVILFVVLLMVLGIFFFPLMFKKSCISLELFFLCLFLFFKFSLVSNSFFHKQISIELCQALCWAPPPCWCYSCFNNSSSYFRRCYRSVKEEMIQAFKLLICKSIEYSFYKVLILTTDNWLYISMGEVHNGMGLFWIILFAYTC